MHRTLPNLGPQVWTARPRSSSGPVAGMSLWLDATTLALSDSDPVATWADQSGNGYDASQATASFRPLYKAAIQNGLPVVRFDGTDDILRAALTLAQPLTWFIVWAPITVGPGAYSVVEASDGNAAAVGVDNSSRLFMYGSTGFEIAADRTLGRFHLEGFVANAGSSAIRRDGSQVATGTTNFTFAGCNLSANTLGGGFYNNDIAEVLVYPSVLSGADITAVETYLNAKWNLY